MSTFLVILRIVESSPVSRINIAPTSGHKTNNAGKFHVKFPIEVKTVKNHPFLLYYSEQQ